MELSGTEFCFMRKKKRREGREMSVLSPLYLVVICFEIEYSENILNNGIFFRMEICQLDS